MKTIVIAAALLTAIGSGAALAQGAPPGSASWQSASVGTTGARQAPAMNARRATMPRPARPTALGRNGRSIPVAGYVQGRYEG